MRTWKAETPGRVPAGARISAGKSGSVDRSLPSSAEVLENWVPVSCMPSPESPAKRMTTSSILSGAAVCFSFSAIMVVSLRLWKQPEPGIHARPGRERQRLLGFPQRDMNLSRARLRGPHPGGGAEEPPLRAYRLAHLDRRDVPVRLSTTPAGLQGRDVSSCRGHRDLLPLSPPDRQDRRSEPDIRTLRRGSRRDMPSEETSRRWWPADVMLKRTGTSLPPSPNHGGRTSKSQREV